MNIILTQQNILKADSTTIEIVKKLSYHCAKLYNVGLYSVKQYFQNTTEYLPYAKNYHICKVNENYKLLRTDVGQQILRLVERDFKSFFALLKLKQSGKYSEKVKTPSYKKDCMTMSIQGRAARIRNGYVFITLTTEFKTLYNIKQSYLKFKLPKNITVTKLQELRIVPKFEGKYFLIEFVYKKEITPTVLNKDNALGIDLGVNNFAACFSYDGDSFLINGRFLKSKNQLYNKILSKTKPKSRKRVRQSIKRSNYINNYFNKAVKFITDFCVNKDIGTIDIGILNKAKINIGKVNNQNFCNIPYGIFIRKLQSKCLQLGIKLHLQDESYTSKCSFLDNEEVCKNENYLGKRVKRGLFQTSKNILVNADINGAANLLKKCNRRLSKRATSGFVTNPIRLNFV